MTRRPPLDAVDFVEFTLRPVLGRTSSVEAVVAVMKDIADSRPAAKATSVASVLAAPGLVPELPILALLVLVPAVQLFPEFSGDGFQVHKVAETSAVALAQLVLPAASFAEVGHGGELGVDGPLVEPAVVELGDGFFGGAFVFELDVDVAD